MATALPVGLIAPPDLHLQTEAFEGSLGTLLTLVGRHAVDLREIPLLVVCEAYLAYLRPEAVNDLDGAAVALAALSYLLERKAFALLPVLEEEPEAYEEPLALEEPTLAFYADVMSELGEGWDRRGALAFRTADPGPFELPYELKDVTGDDLARALGRVLARAKPPELPHLRTPRRSLAEVIEAAFAALAAEYRPFDRLVPSAAERDEVVFWFLAVLELVRTGRARLRAGEADVEFARVVAPKAALA